MAVETDVRLRVGYKFDLDELEQFIQKARENGDSAVTWDAYAGDQRDPSELRLIAVKN